MGFTLRSGLRLGFTLIIVRMRVHGARSVFPFKSEVARKVLLAIDIARESFFHVDDKLTIKNC